ncbi:hypothetical protein M501DRAFT_1018343 [Patellaria atrata CBS 101060]|uniref:Uncharacterized protein n=1 Tax=Patellaria atrata CBS 101060 TaxID=1346257 RepID=A0A9P4S693_9PEZI|nr:hypothetical protein M501DRAFT_1018343 [Patellaria atrata CBS 101060]
MPSSQSPMNNISITSDTNSISQCSQYNQFEPNFNLNRPHSRPSSIGQSDVESTSSREQKNRPAVIYELEAIEATHSRSSGLSTTAESPPGRPSYIPYSPPLQTSPSPGSAPAVEGENARRDVRQKFQIPTMPRSAAQPGSSSPTPVNHESRGLTHNFHDSLSQAKTETNLLYGISQAPELPNIESLSKTIQTITVTDRVATLFANLPHILRSKRDDTRPTEVFAQQRSTPQLHLGPFSISSPSTLAIESTDSASSDSPPKDVRKGFRKQSAHWATNEFLEHMKVPSLRPPSPSGHFRRASTPVYPPQNGRGGSIPNISLTTPTVSQSDQNCVVGPSSNNPRVFASPIMGDIGRRHAPPRSITEPVLQSQNLLNQSSKVQPYAQHHYMSPVIRFPRKSVPGAPQIPPKIPLTESQQMELTSSRFLPQNGSITKSIGEPQSFPPDPSGSSHRQTFFQPENPISHYPLGSRPVTTLDPSVKNVSSQRTGSGRYIWAQPLHHPPPPDFDLDLDLDLKPGPSNSAADTEIPHGRSSEHGQEEGDHTQQSDVDRVPMLYPTPSNTSNRRYAWSLPLHYSPPLELDSEPSGHTSDAESPQLHPQEHVNKETHTRESPSANNLPLQKLQTSYNGSFTTFTTLSPLNHPPPQTTKPSPPCRPTLESSIPQFRPGRNISHTSHPEPQSPPLAGRYTWSQRPSTPAAVASPNPIVPQSSHYPHRERANQTPEIEIRLYHAPTTGTRTGTEAETKQSHPQPRRYAWALPSTNPPELPAPEPSLPHATQTSERTKTPESVEAVGMTVAEKRRRAARRRMQGI